MGGYFSFAGKGGLLSEVVIMAVLIHVSIRIIPTSWLASHPSY